MISEISRSLIPHSFYEHGCNPCGSFLGRCFSLNWNKVHLLANLIFVVSGIAYVFFTKLPPMMMFCLGLYGCVVVLFYAKARQSSPSQNHIDDLQEKLSTATEKNTLLEEKFKGEMSAKKISETLQDEISTNTQKLAALKAGIQQKRKEKKSLQSVVAKLHKVLDALESEAKKARPNSAEYKALRAIKSRLNQA